MLHAALELVHLLVVVSAPDGRPIVLDVTVDLELLHLLPVQLVLLGNLPGGVVGDSLYLDNVLLHHLFLQSQYLNQVVFSLSLPGFNHSQLSRYNLKLQLLGDGIASPHLW